MVLEIGRVCVKIAGRDAGQIGVIVDVLDNKTVLIDGQVRRRKCNILHLEPTSKTVKIEKGASHNSVISALKGVGIEVVERKPRKAVKKPKKVRKGKAPVAKKPVPAKTPAVAPKAPVKPAPKTPTKTVSKKPATS